MRWIAHAGQRNQAALAAVVAAAATVGFYLLIGLPGWEGSLLYRYTTGHPIEYATVAAFLWAMVGLLLKGVEQVRQGRALQYAWLPVADRSLPSEDVDALARRVAEAPELLRNTVLGRRLANVLDYVREKRSSDGLEDHLRYLADFDADESHGSFGLARIIAWMIPILGFLGTVVGITLAIANVTPSQLETSLSEVTGGLAVAFDTTALSLSLSMVLMLAMFLIERFEQQLLQRIETYVHRSFAGRFASVDPSAAPYLSAVRAASEQVIAHTKDLVHKQVELWAQSSGRLHELQVQSIQRQEERVQRLLEGLKSEGQVQSQALAQATERMTQLTGKLNELTQTLVQVVQGEKQLVNSQQRLAENLHVLQQSQRMDEALHSLSAAIHLLMARHQPMPTSSIGKVA